MISLNSTDFRASHFIVFLRDWQDKVCYHLELRAKIYETKLYEVASNWTVVFYCVSFFNVPGGVKQSHDLCSVCQADEKKKKNTSKKW